MQRNITKLPMNDKIKSRFFLFFPLCTLVVCLVGCSGKEHYEGERSKKELQRLSVIYDSMMTSSSQVMEELRFLIQQTEDSLSWYDYYLLYGRHYLLTATPDSLLPYSDRTLQFVARQEPTPRTNGLAAMAYSLKASYLHLLHHTPDSVIALYRKSYNLLMQSDLIHMTPDMSANLGDAYISISDLPSASKWYRRALYLNDSLQLPEQHTLSLYMGLGRIYTMLRDFEQAKEYYEMADKRQHELKPNMQSYFLNNYGNYYYYKKEYRKALEMFMRMKQFLQEHGAEEHFDMYLCKINLADVYLNLGITDSARYYIAEPETYFNKLHVDVGIYYAQTIRIGIAIKEHKYDEVKHLLQTSKVLDISDIDIKSIRNDYLREYYAAIGDYQQAYQGLKGNLAMLDSAEHLRKGMRSSDIMMRFTEDTIRLHHQIEMNRLDIEYANNRQWFILITAVLVITVLLFIIYFNLQRKRYLQTRIDMLTQRLMNARQRVSPHFIFNILNSYISKANQPESEQLQMLAHLIRTNLDLTHKTFVTLHDELDFVRQYVDLVRKSGSIDFRFSINLPPNGEAVCKVRLPSMMIQILTENAILHGIKQKEGERILTITVADQGANISITVYDNGPGFDMRRYNSTQARTGLNIIRTTISTVNQENDARKMSFDIHNDNGRHATLTIAKDTQYPSPITP